MVKQIHPITFIRGREGISENIKDFRPRHPSAGNAQPVDDDQPADEPVVEPVDDDPSAGESDDSTEPMSEEDELPEQLRQQAPPKGAPAKP